MPASVDSPANAATAVAVADCQELNRAHFHFDSLPSGSVGPIRQRWQRPDHYHWLSGYLGDRNVRGFTRKMMGFIVGC